MKLAEHLSNSILRSLSLMNENDFNLSIKKVISELQKINKIVIEHNINCFISHTWAGNQHNFAKYLASRINKYKDVSAWLDENKITAGENILQKINAVLINESNVFICILSEEYLSSAICRAELNKAFTLNKNNQILLIPLKYSDCETPLELQGLLWADFRDTTTTSGNIISNVYNPKLQCLISSIREYYKSNVPQLGFIM